MQTPIHPPTRKDELLGHNLFQGGCNIGHRVADPLFQKPPLDDAFNRVLCLWMLAEIANDFIGQRAIISFRGAFHTSWIRQMSKQ